MPLIGIVTGIALLAASPNDSSRVVSTEAERLADMLSLASDEAVNNNQQMGLLFDEKAYYFVILDEQSQTWEASWASFLVCMSLSLTLAYIY